MKDTPDRPDEPLPLPARRTSPPPVAPAAEAYYDEPEPPAGPAKKRISARLVARALRRHWWQALVLWVAGSAGLVVLAYQKIKPTFDAASQILVDVDRTGIFDKSGAPDDLGQFMKTQVAIITSPNVTSSALVSSPKLTLTSVLNGSPDPPVALRKALRVGVIPGTNLIQVELSSPIPAEAADLVNAVVDAYLKEAEKTYTESSKTEIDTLTEIRDKQQEEVETQRKHVQSLSERLGAADVEAAKDRNIATVDSYRRMSEELTRVGIMRIAAKTKVEQLRNERALPVKPMDKEGLEAALVDAFYVDPVVSEVEAQLTRAESRLREVKRRARKPDDPAVVHAAQQVKELKQQKDDLWRGMEPRLRRQLTAGPSGDEASERALKEAEIQFSSIVAQEEMIRDTLDKLKVEDKTAESNALKLEYARYDLTSAQNVLADINRRLHQREIEAKHPVARMSCRFRAAPTAMPNADRRTQVMAAAPLLFGFVVCGLLVLLELRGARVGDPEELVDRIKVQVIGVVPPLPQIRSAGPAGGPPAVQGDFRAQRQLDEFVQSLDHLRVALCARPDPWGRDRHCVLITSACGSEGKTTLAAQLAERCVNAGLMTLLIDADLRNPTLSRMLDAHDNPGLINVLRGELMAEDVVMVIGDAGGFHLLPAGTPRVDPSRLLQGDRLGKLLAQARESFEMIIVDAPPVLPVPDALTIGRWTDGAVLAVRYDTSRFPLVERANRRLAHVGVPVIGAVVNGVRTVESSYGGYYAYGYGSYGSPAPSASPVAED